MSAKELPHCNSITPAPKGLAMTTHGDAGIIARKFESAARAAREGSPKRAARLVEWGLDDLRRLDNHATEDDRR